MHKLVQCWVSIVGNDRVQPVSRSAVEEVILQEGEDPWGAVAPMAPRPQERAGRTGSGQDTVVAAESGIPSQSWASYFAATVTPKPQSC